MCLLARICHLSVVSGTMWITISNYSIFLSAVSHESMKYNRLLILNLTFFPHANNSINFFLHLDYGE